MSATWHDPVRSRPSRGPAVMLGLCAAGLALSLAYLITRPIDVAPVAVSGAGPQSLAAAEPSRAPLPALPPLADLQATRDRPLFSPARRPAPDLAVAESPAEPSASAEGMRLVGMVRQGGTHSRALIRPSAEAQAVWVPVGQEIAGWTLQSVSRNFVVLKRDSQTAELQLFPVR